MCVCHDLLRATHVYGDAWSVVDGLGWLVLGDERVEHLVVLPPGERVQLVTVQLEVAREAHGVPAARRPRHEDARDLQRRGPVWGRGGGLSLISLGGKGRNVPFLTKIMITSQREKEIYTVTTEKIISHESYE